MENRLDKIFDVCLLLITVISAAELQYASTLLQNDINQLNEVFRSITIPLFFIIIIWLFVMVFPSSGFWTKLKNVGKAFCWELFGTFFVLLIITFNALSFPNDVKTTPLSGELAIFLVAFLTIYTTWNYLKENFYKPNWFTKSLVVLIHLILFSASYLIVFIILGFSIILPTP
jgi:hypothetical protein